MRMHSMNDGIVYPRILQFALIALGILGIPVGGGSAETASNILLRDQSDSGLGLLVREIGTNLTVLAVLPGGPAEMQGGVKSGDVLLALAETPGPSDFKSFAEKSLEQCYSLMRGPVGSSVLLKVLPKEETTRADPQAIMCMLTRRHFTISGDTAFDRKFQQILEQLPLTNVATVSIDWKGFMERLAERDRDLRSQFEAGVISGDGLREKKHDNPDAVMPNVSDWTRVSVGMEKKDVLVLLGIPMEGRGSDVWSYGVVHFNSEAFPRQFAFRVFFENGRVSAKEDPFEGQFSDKGKPTVPRLQIPLNGIIFSHYPRFLDVRWTPSAGQYPMQYIVQIDTLIQNEWVSKEFTAAMPYHCIAFSGANEGRWRVKATNALGESNWSEFSLFKFTR